MPVYIRRHSSLKHILFEKLGSSKSFLILHKIEFYWKIFSLQISIISEMIHLISLLINLTRNFKLSSIIHNLGLLDFDILFKFLHMNAYIHISNRKMQKKYLNLFSNCVQHLSIVFYKLVRLVIIF